MVGKLFGKKLGMTRYFLDEGKSVPVTIVKMEPCVVIQKKTQDRDGYEAIQVGFQAQKESRLNKPAQGHFKKAGDRAFRYLREIRVEDASQFELGQEIGTDIFTIGEVVNVSGKSKGRGFSGVIKRWGFSGGKDTHGCRSHRVPGSIGSSQFPGRVLKGKKLPGRMGFHRTTIKNLTILDVRPEMDVIALKGAVPGSRNTLVEITKTEG
ncbi:MAG: 50S ribosomal protein L3 [Deltaproteobacteria bacterium]|nr:50S ribosomal protein L3 [Deltaproteobacteria bacterium]